jgi:hypothetical protein
MLYSNELLDEMRLEGDTLADCFIETNFADDAARLALRAHLGLLTDNISIKAFYNHYPQDTFLKEAAHLPAWSDAKLMQQGAMFFAKHAQLIMNMLGLLSLPYCYAAADGANVLYLSERIRQDTAKRLFETAGFVWDVMAPDAFMPAGKGFASIINVRLMHAAARFYVSKHPNWSSAYGYPVNQEDMAGTNLSFSLIVIRGLRKFGLTISYADQQAFIHLWNVIGSMLGLKAELLPQTGKQATALEETIRLRQFKPSAQGQQLTRALIDYFATVDTGRPFSKTEMLQLMRYLLTNPVADMLGIPAQVIPPGTVNLLKAISNLQLLKPQPTYQLAYQQQYAQFKKQRDMAIK